MDFPSNSQNVTGNNKQLPKEELPKKDVQKVVSGEVIQKPKSIGRRFKEIFFGGEAKNASRYVVADVLLPAFKNMVVDATSKGVERVVYGDASPRRRIPPIEYGRPRFSYNQPVDRYAQSPRGRLPDQLPQRVENRRHQANEIIVVSRDEAEIVLERLTDIIEKYGTASVADLHDLVGLPTTYVDNKWGWTGLRYANIHQRREGYLLDLPPVEEI